MYCVLLVTLRPKLQLSLILKTTPTINWGLEQILPPYPWHYFPSPYHRYALGMFFQSGPLSLLGLEPFLHFTQLGCGSASAWLLTGGLPLGAGSGATCLQLPDGVSSQAKPSPSLASQCQCLPSPVTEAVFPTPWIPWRFEPEY